MNSHPSNRPLQPNLAPNLSLYLRACVAPSCSVSVSLPSSFIRAPCLRLVCLQITIYLLDLFDGKKIKKTRAEEVRVDRGECKRNQDGGED